MKTFTLYTVNPSRGSMIRWMLEECGADYDTVALSLGADLKTPEYLAVNPMGKVPALQHKGETFTETAAILTYRRAISRNTPDPRSRLGRTRAILPLAVLFAALGIRRNG